MTNSRALEIANSANPYAICTAAELAGFDWMLNDGVEDFALEGSEDGIAAARIVLDRRAAAAAKMLTDALAAARTARRCFADAAADPATSREVWQQIVAQLQRAHTAVCMAECDLAAREELHIFILAAEKIMVRAKPAPVAPVIARADLVQMVRQIYNALVETRRTPTTGSIRILAGQNAKFLAGGPRTESNRISMAFNEHIAGMTDQEIIALSSEAGL